MLSISSLVCPGGARCKVRTCSGNHENPTNVSEPRQKWFIDVMHQSFFLSGFFFTRWYDLSFSATVTAAYVCLHRSSSESYQTNLKPHHSAHTGSNGAVETTSSQSFDCSGREPTVRAAASWDPNEAAAQACQSTAPVGLPAAEYCFYYWASFFF